MTAIAIQRRDEIIQNLASGLRLSEIAPIIGVCTNALSKALKSDPDYRAAIETGFHVRLDKAEQDIEAARAMVDVTRAGTKFKALAWRAEREFPETWGQKSQVTVNMVDLGDRLRRARERIIDGECSAVPQQTAQITGNSE